jgi:FSR family fosmidomycin resistance protein-like MFS transporter
MAPNFTTILLAVILMGIGSAIFHPESSRVAYLAAGGKRGLAQSIFQVGGNIGSSLGPIMTAVLFVPLGQFGVIWFAFAALAGIAIQYYVAGWYKQMQAAPRPSSKRRAAGERSMELSRFQVVSAVLILVFLVFSKYVYMSSITSFFSFYLIDGFGVTVEHAQLFLFAFLFAAAAGTFFGGPLADRYGRRNMIWLSIFGTAPFSILLPYADLFWACILVACAGFVLSSAFSIIVVYAQELLPGNVGLVSGLFFGLAFGLGGLGSVVLGWIADATSIAYIMKLCAYLPLLGVLAVFLPKDRKD